MVTMLSRLFDIENYFENYLQSDCSVKKCQPVPVARKSKRERENVRSL